jgi:hypothetical protein
MNVRIARVAAVALAVAMLPLSATTQAQDVRALQVREAQKTDERTLAYFARFRSALVERFGADPLLTALVFSENEASALVHASAAAPAQFVIFQEDKWIGTDGRELKAWAPNADPSVARFRLSRVTEAFIRERFRAHRAVAARASDHLSPVRVGYFGKPFDRMIMEVQVLSLSKFGMSTAAYDLATGASLDVDAAIADARTQREAAAKKDAAEAKAAAQRNLVREVPTILAQYRKEMGPTRLMAVWIERQLVTFIQTDSAVVDYDRRGRFSRRAGPYDSGWLCVEGFDDREVDWAGFAILIEKAMLARNLDEEDREHARIDVERQRGCAPTTIEVKFTNYKTPWPFAVFDAGGRLVRAR